MLAKGLWQILAQCGTARMKHNVNEAHSRANPNRRVLGARPTTHEPVPDATHVPVLLSYSSRIR